MRKSKDAGTDRPVRRSSFRALRRRGTGLLEKLDLPADCDLTTVVARVSEHIGQPIRLQAAPIPAGTDNLTGLCFTDPDGLVWIIVEQLTSRSHQEVIALHELSHLLYNHNPDRVLAEDEGLALAPHAPDAMKVLCRSHEDTEPERHVEVLAWLLARRLRRGAREPLDTKADPELRRLLAVFEDRE